MTKELPPSTSPSKDWQPDFKKAEKISFVEEEVFRRLVPKFNASRIDMDEFEGVYTKEEIARDKQSVERKESNFEDPDSPFHKRAQILEALLAEQIDLNLWFDESTTTIIPTKYDDSYNGVDVAAEFQRDNSLQHLAMGVDVTISKMQVFNKLNIIREKLRKGKLTEMKYFTSERLPDFHGRMANIASIVIGADPRTINELAGLWLTIDRSKNPEVEIDRMDQEDLREQARNAQQYLARHRAQVLILTEIEIQLEFFVQYAKKAADKEEDPKIREAIEEIIPKLNKPLAIVRDILKTKKISKRDQELNDSDDVFRAIKSNLEEFF